MTQSQQLWEWRILTIDEVEEEKEHDVQRGVDIPIDEEIATIFQLRHGGLHLL